MRLFGRNRQKAKPDCSTKPRKRETPTTAEARLQKRIESFNASTRGLPNPKAAGFTRPGSLKRV